MHFLEKNKENVRKHRDIRLVTIAERRNPLVSKPNYHKNFFFRKFVSHGNEKNKTNIHE